MDIFNSSHSQQEDQKQHPQQFHSKKRLSHDQVRLLERSFTSHKKLDPELKQKLASQLGVPPRQVAIWYQNKRARWKTQSLELDYNTIQVRLENALAEKRRLEKDVKQLREELRQAKEMLFASNYNNNQKAVVEANCCTTVVSCNNYSSATSCSDQKGCSSSFSLLHEENYVHGGDHHRDDHDYRALQIDRELYACLIGAGGSGWG